MLPATHTLGLSFKALRRNRMQTVLAMLGVTVGVAALVTSIALGNGAQDAIEDQLRAAGANVIVITAGNYQVQKPEGTEGDAGHQASLRRFGPDLLPVAYGPRATEHRPDVSVSLQNAVHY